MSEVDNLSWFVGGIDCVEKFLRLDGLFGLTGGDILPFALSCLISSECEDLSLPFFLFRSSLKSIRSSSWTGAFASGSDRGLVGRAGLFPGASGSRCCDERLRRLPSLEEII